MPLGHMRTCEGCGSSEPIVCETCYHDEVDSLREDIAALRAELASARAKEERTNAAIRKLLKHSQSNPDNYLCEIDGDLYAILDDKQEGQNES